ncbi:molybdopterin-containing oxidoreductase family protein [Trujillonella endophytica]|uniref:Anaerobic selenocysteine-containing dehydrogenase n=1 Tax=Trujillonella endophytica TaxID=673521 RepID=A0A1H8QUI8_9ACTN|nr:molybdopterin-dependent oxidoreductase [Trujillella endophytica]SEO57621.1 Anaerobic selenocysteine-containing dehydrogenase [Trujillella endophytica]
MVETVRFNCELCMAMCGMIATVEDGRLVDVKGDRDHPTSAGYTCAKGRALPERHHGDGRLDFPRLRGERVSWDTLLDDATGEIQRLIAEGGPNSVAGYYATGQAFSGGAYPMLDLLAQLGSNQVYSPMTLDVAPRLRAAELVTGIPFLHPSWFPEEGPTLCVMLGTNPTTSGGWIGSARANMPQRLRGFRARGGELWVVDPRRSSSAKRADRHLAPRPGTDHFLLAWLARELLDKGHDAHEVASACDPADVERLRAAVAPFTLEVVAERTDLAADDLIELLAAIRRHGKVVLLGGTCLGFQPEGVVAEWLALAVMIITGSLDVEGGLKYLSAGHGMIDGPAFAYHAPEDGSASPGPASRPDLDGLLGQFPAVTLPDEIESGQVRALLVFGGNPLTSVPDPDRMRAALAKLDVLVVIDPFDVEITKMATHAMPCAWVTERTSFIHEPLQGLDRSYLSPPVVPPGGERQQSWWIIAQLARRLGKDVLDGLDPDTSDDDTVVRHLARARADFAEEVFAGGSHGAAVPTGIGWVHEKMLPGGRWRLAPRVLLDRLTAALDQESGGLRLVAGRRMNSLNSRVYALEDGTPPIVISAAAARDHAISNGDRVRVSTASGAVEGLVEVDAALGDAAVYINHGWLEQNVNRIIDRMPDRLTLQPVFTGISVQLERVDAQ